jgi:hypothetical protein
VTVLSVIGYELGSDWTKASKHFSQASNILAVGVVVGLAALIAYKWWELRKERRADAAMSSDNPGADSASNPSATKGPRHRASSDRQGG